MDNQCPKLDPEQRLRMLLLKIPVVQNGFYTDIWHSQGYIQNQVTIMLCTSKVLWFHPPSQWTQTSVMASVLFLY